MRKFFTVAGTAAAAVLVAITPMSASSATPATDGGALTIAVYGDAPYGTNPTDDSEFLATPAFIRSVASSRILAVKLSALTVTP